MTALHHAAYGGWEDTVETLISHGADIQARSDLWGTPLHLSAAKGRVNVVRLLLRSRAAVNCRSGLLGTPLHSAGLAVDSACARLLMQAGGSPNAIANVWMEDRPLRSSIPRTLERVESSTGALYECTPLAVTVEAQAPSITEPLTSSPHVVTCRIKFRNSNRPRLFATGDLWEVQDLTPLILAVQMKSLSLSSVLLDGSARADDTMAKGRTALQVAAEVGDFHICRLLLEKGARVDQARSDGLTALIAAAHHGQDQCVRLLLKHAASTNAVHAHNVTALSSAVYQGHPHTTKIILEHDQSSVSFRNVNQGTLLHVAIQSFHAHAGDYRAVEIVRQLLKYGVSPLDQDENRETPLAMLERNSAEIPDAFLRNVWAMKKLLRDAMEAQSVSTTDSEEATEPSEDLSCHEVK